MDADLRKSEILVIDDNVMNLKLISSLLKTKHYRVHVLSDGMKICDSLQKSIPDLILLDVMMPKKSGYEICISIKQDNRFSKIPVIFLTALNDTESIIKCFSVGAADYLSKPVNPQELFARIETHLNLKINMEKLEETRRELDTFNQMISHDLKSPMLMIGKLSRYLDQYKEKIDDPNYEEIILGISQKANEIASTMEKYYELSKLSNTRLYVQPIDLNELLRKLIDESHIGSDTQIELGELPEISGDPLLIKNAFKNIIANALKFSRDRHPAKIQIGSRYLESGTLVFVRDNGVGFNMKYSADIFSLFVRLHSQKDFEGTGTGLAIVKKIIELHGGKVWIEAEENKGATVFLIFP